MDVLSGLFDGDVPDREWVLSQTIEFDPEYRKTRLPDARMWPPELDDCPPYRKLRGVDRPPGVRYCGTRGGDS